MLYTHREEVQFEFPRMANDYLTRFNRIYINAYCQLYVNTESIQYVQVMVYSINISAAYTGIIESDVTIIYYNLTLYSWQITLKIQLPMRNSMKMLI